MIENIMFELEISTMQKIEKESFNYTCKLL